MYFGATMPIIFQTSFKFAKQLPLYKISGSRKKYNTDHCWKLKSCTEGVIIFGGEMEAQQVVKVGSDSINFPIVCSQRSKVWLVIRGIYKLLYSCISAETVPTSVIIKLKKKNSVRIKILFTQPHLIQLLLLKSLSVRNFAGKLSDI